MTAMPDQRVLESLILHIKGLAFVQALLEPRVVGPAELAGHGAELDREPTTALAGLVAHHVPHAA
jgi:hypothetical protein